MKKLLLLCAVLAFCNTVNAQVDTLAIKKIFNEVRTEWAPDRRSVYFNMQIKGDTVLVESTSQNAINAIDAKVKGYTGLVLMKKLLPLAELNGFNYGLANLSVCNNRAAPQNAAEMMTQMLLGTPVEVLKKQGGFYLVKTPDGYLSWTDGTAVSLMNKAGFESWKKAKRIIYLADYGHAFSKASDKSLRVSDLVRGNILEIKGEEGAFYHVLFPDKRLGYVSKKEAGLFDKWQARANPKAEAILATAKTLLGVPYLWGGTSVKGVDCSGFTKTSYFLNGIIIPRDASQQALVGENIDVLDNDSTSIDKCLNNLQAGDLLFFAAAKLRGATNGRVTHTAIYMGNGEFIQSAGMVRINSLNPSAPNFDEREYRSLVSAKRYLKHIGTNEITRVDEHEWYGR